MSCFCVTRRSRSTNATDRGPEKLLRLLHGVGDGWWRRGWTLRPRGIGYVFAERRRHAASSFDAKGLAELDRGSGGLLRYRIGPCLPDCVAIGAASSMRGRESVRLCHCACCVTAVAMLAVLHDWRGALSVR